jgi:hypothetical protein
VDLSNVVKERDLFDDAFVVVVEAGRIGDDERVCRNSADMCAGL